MPSCPHHRWPFRQLPQFLVQGSVCLLEFTVQGWRKGPHQPKDHVALQKVPVERKETHKPHGSGDPSCKVVPCISHLDSWEKPLPSVFIEMSCLTVKKWRSNLLGLGWSGVEEWWNKELDEETDFSSHRERKIWTRWRLDLDFIKLIHLLLWPRSLSSEDVSSKHNKAGIRDLSLPWWQLSYRFDLCLYVNLLIPTWMLVCFPQKASLDVAATELLWRRAQILGRSPFRWWPHRYQRWRKAQHRASPSCPPPSLTSWSFPQGLHIWEMASASAFPPEQPNHYLLHPILSYASSSHPHTSISNWWDTWPS